MIIPIQSLYFIGENIKVQTENIMWLRSRWHREEVWSFLICDFWRRHLIYGRAIGATEDSELKHTPWRASIFHCCWTSRHIQEHTCRIERPPPSPLNPAISSVWFISFWKWTWHMEYLWGVTCQSPWVSLGLLQTSNSGLQSWVLIRMCKTSEAPLQMSRLHHCLADSCP